MIARSCSRSPIGPGGRCMSPPGLAGVVGAGDAREPPRRSRPTSTGAAGLGATRSPTRAAGPARDLAIRARDVVESLPRGRPGRARATSRSTSRDRSAWDRLVLDGVRSIPRGDDGELRRGGAPDRPDREPRGPSAGRWAATRSGLLVPCHRVIAGDGTLGGYGVAAWGGREAALDLKRGAARARGRPHRLTRGCRLRDTLAVTRRSHGARATA